MLRSGFRLFVVHLQQGEEKVVEDAMKSISDAGTKVIIAGGTVRGAEWIHQIHIIHLFVQLFQLLSYSILVIWYR